MIKSYFHLVFRHFAKEKSHAAIIIVGLAIGIASALIIAQYIQFELSFDRQPQSRDEIYYAYTQWIRTNGQVDGKCFPALAPFVEQRIPEIKSSVRILPLSSSGNTNIILRREENGKVIVYSEMDDLYLADPSVLKFFSMRLLKGNAETALQSPHTVVITKSLADKFFPDEDPMNRLLSVMLPNGMKEESVITGVIDDPSPNSSIKFSALYSLESIKSIWNIDEFWEIGEFQTFFRLHPGADVKSVEHRINEITDPMRKLEAQLNIKLAIRLLAFQDFHFFRHQNTTTTKQVEFTGDKRLLTYFGILGSLIMLISWANYINLTTARAIGRAKEVGLRKISGATRKNLILQFFLEYLFINVVSFVLALTFTQLLFDLFAHLIGSKAQWIFWSSPVFWVVVIGLVIVSTIISGIYPALVISDYKPVKVLKGNFSMSQAGAGLRKSLVIFQFALSVFMIMSIYVILRQLYFIQQKDLGLSIEQVVVIKTTQLGGRNRIDAFNEMKAKLSGNIRFKDFSTSGIFPGEGVPRALAFKLTRKGDEETRIFEFNAIQENYFSTMGIKLLHGRDFLASQRSDSTKVIITAKAANDLGFKDPGLAIGEKITSGDTQLELEVIGVVDNFNLNMKKAAVGEIFLTKDIKAIEESAYRVFLVKLSSTDVQESIALMEKEWKSLFPDAPFDFFFLDSYFETFYREERQFAGVFAFFSVIGIVITCMGLFGLSLYDTSSRNKEIGIRKSLGASVLSIIWMFSKIYIKLVAFAAIIGIPTGYFLLQAWLTNYPKHISLQADAVLVPAGLMCCIALLTVGYQTLKTARINPVVSLRSE